MNKNKKLILEIIFSVIFILIILIPNMQPIINNINSSKINTADATTFNIISSSENEDLEDIVKNYAKTKGYNINIEYAGTLDIMSKLNNGEKYDAVWISNSIWLYMLNSAVKTSNSKCTSINPVIFGIKKSKAKELGFIGKDVYTKDILNAISSKKLKFSMSNPTTTNSGASAYLGMLSTLAGNPEVLTEDNLNNQTLKDNLKTLFSGLERSSGSEEFLEELFLKGDYEAVVTYESSIINLNEKLIQQGKEPLYMIYPVDGVSIADSPFAYIDNKDSSKKQIFTDIQSYILSNEGQQSLQEKGRRTWYGGISNNVDKNIFNPDWGIDTTKYISPIKYPSTNVIKLALNLYQSELRKPIHVAFCLDYSGSMYGTGNTQLMSAMDYILTDKAASDFLQFSNKDKIDIIPFSTTVQDVWSTVDGSITNQLLTKIHNLKPDGSTALYPAAEKALEILKNEDMNNYNVSIILMTDGMGNIGAYSDLATSYTNINKQIPIYSIMFGQANQMQLNKIASLTNAKVFDGKQDLVKAFKEVRGYN